MRQRTLPIAGIGTPGPYRLVASFLTSSLVAFGLTAIALVDAADDLARGTFAAPDVLLAAHLLVLGFLTLGVGGAAFHILPLVLRGTPHSGRAWASLACLLSGSLLAVGIARHAVALTWAAAAVFGVGLALLLGECLRLVARSPGGRIAVVSRFGVTATAVHAILSVAVGAVLFDARWRPWAGIPHERLIAIHLHLAVVGAITLLIVTVGRALVPMLASAPAAPKRRFPTDEVAVTVALWIGVAGLAAGETWLVALGGALLVAAVARFLALVARTLRTRRVPAVEGPLLHALAGIAFLAESAVLGALLLDRPGDTAVLAAYVLSILLGWGAGVTLGHVGKLLSLSAWTWWPPGPRPRQSAFYHGKAWTAEVVAFAAGVELMIAGSLAGSVPVSRAGAVLLVLAAVLALRGAVATLSLTPIPRVPRARDGGSAPPQADRG